MGKENIVWFNNGSILSKKKEDREYILKQPYLQESCSEVL
jgi:hypothetical protein